MKRKVQALIPASGDLLIPMQDMQDMSHCEFFVNVMYMPTTTFFTVIETPWSEYFWPFGDPS